jgi:hypothetical protein
MVEYRCEYVWICLRSFRSITADKGHKDRVVSDTLNREKSFSHKYVLLIL